MPRGLPVTGGCLKATVMHPHSLTVAGAAGELQQILLRTPFPFHLWLMIEPKTPVAVCPVLQLIAQPDRTQAAQEFGCN
jgi:hypothetical protein